MNEPTFSETMERTHPVQMGTESVPPPFDPERDEYLYGDDTTTRPGCAFAALAPLFPTKARVQTWFDSLHPYERWGIALGCAVAGMLLLAALFLTGLDRDAAYVGHGGGR